MLVGSPVERHEALRAGRLRLLGVDVGFAKVSDLELPSNRSFDHQASSSLALERALDSLDITADDAVVDIGCGKGGAMMVLHRYPFARVDGVEISASLVTTARRNIWRLGMVKSAVICCDAGRFDGYDPYSFLYLYNPFPEVVVREVLARVAASLARRPRVLTLIYMNPTAHKAVCESGFALTRAFDALERERHTVIHVYRGPNADGLVPAQKDPILESGTTLTTDTKH